jgi:hypothetical protein
VGCSAILVSSTVVLPDVSTPLSFPLLSGQPAISETDTAEGAGGPWSLSEVEVELVVALVAIEPFSSVYKWMKA